MTTLRVLIVDDEHLARLRLRQLVAECPAPRAEVVGEAADAAQALAWLAERACDVVLLDIHMPGADGTRLAAHLAEAGAQGHLVPAIVFVTAHAEHALRAFEVDAVDYLTKPVRRERLQAALRRVEQRLSASAGGGSPSASDAADAPAALVVNDRGRVTRIPLSDVLYLKAELKYVTVRTATGTHLLNDALSELEQRLGQRFLRIHRNALVARHALRALERRTLPAEGDDEGGEAWAVRVAGVDEWLAVSRRQVQAVRDVLGAAGL